MFHKYVKIKRFGHEDNVDILAEDSDIIYIESKMDGANTRMAIIDDKLHYGTRNQELTDADENSKKPWKEFIEFAESVKDNLRPNYIYYMEYMIPHTIRYDFKRMPRFLGFDIYDLKINKFILPEEAIKMFKEIGVEFVPIVQVGTAKEIKEVPLDESIIPQSKYYNGKDEGVVIKNYNKQIFAKIVRSEFKEINKRIFSRKKKKVRGNDQTFVNKYVTEARIRKLIFKLRDNGKSIDMRLMKDLIPLVWEDLWEEEWKAISKERGTYNFDNIRYKLIPIRIRHVLERVIIEQGNNRYRGDE